MSGERAFVDINVKRALLREYLKEEVKRAGFGGADIQRTPMGTRVTLYTERPGLVIGRKGDSIKALTDAIQFDFGFDKPQVEVVEVENPNLNAQIMSEKLASALERGWHFRRAGHSTVRRIMDNGAKGCQIIISGKLTGQRHRTEKFKEGHIKFCGEPKLQWMEEGFTPAKLKQGVIGVKVQIMHPKARLPDEVNIREPKEMEAAAAAKAEADAAAEAALEPIEPTTTTKRPSRKKKSEASTPETESPAPKPIEPTPAKVADAPKVIPVSPAPKPIEPTPAPVKVVEPEKPTPAKVADAPKVVPESPAPKPIEPAPAPAETTKVEATEPEKIIPPTKTEVAKVIPEPSKPVVDNKKTEDENKAEEGQ